MFWHGKQMYGRLSDEVLSAGLAAGGADPRPVTDEDISGLPSTVQRYLRAMGVVHRPRDWSFLAHFTGRFRLKGRGLWMRSVPTSRISKSATGSLLCSTRPPTRNTP